jgi:hypothetical protein
MKPGDKVRYVQVDTKPRMGKDGFRVARATELAYVGEFVREVGASSAQVRFVHQGRPIIKTVARKSLQILGSPEMTTEEGK